MIPITPTATTHCPLATRTARLCNGQWRATLGRYTAIAPTPVAARIALERKLDTLKRIEMESRA